MSIQSIFVTDNAVRFGDKLAASAAFKALFKEGMALVEETAAYLDGKGRDDARHLPRGVALAYASESMRLTTRLMQIASWLLLQRAVNEGEMTQNEASSDKRRASIAWQAIPRPDNPAHELPAALIALIETSLRLQERIAHLDGLITGPVPAAMAGGAQPLDAQMDRLRQAFPGT